MLSALSAPAARAQQPDADWPMYRRDLAGTGYSPLKQINTGNVTKLAQAWSLVLADRGGLWLTPIVVNGVMYLPATDRVLAASMPPPERKFGTMTLFTPLRAASPTGLEIKAIPPELSSPH